MHAPSDTAAENAVHTLQTLWIIMNTQNKLLRVADESTHPHWYKRSHRETHTPTRTHKHKQGKCIHHCLFEEHTQCNILEVHCLMCVCVCVCVYVCVSM